MLEPPSVFLFFFFNDPAPPEIYPLPLHAALPISLPRTRISGSALGSSAVSPLQPNHSPPVCWRAASTPTARPPGGAERRGGETRFETQDRKSTRLNSSHSQISYAVFCLKKKKKKK